MDNTPLIFPVGLVGSNVQIEAEIQNMKLLGFELKTPTQYHVKLLAPHELRLAT
jgi:hypothetical protein